MMKTLLSYTTVLLFILALSWQTEAQSSRIILSEISSPYVSDVTQDSDGYIWIGTNHGLDRFNGSNYKIFNCGSGPADIRNDNIYDVEADRQGRVWFASESGLGVFEDGGFRFPKSSGFHMIGKIADLDESYILVSDKEGLAKIRKSDFSETDRFSRPNIVAVSNYCVAGDRIWVAGGTGRSEVIYILDKYLRLMETKTLSGKSRMIGIEWIGDEVWAAYEDGLEIYGIYDMQPKPVPEELSLLHGKSIKFIAPAGDKVFIGLAGLGIFAYSRISGSLERVFPDEILSAGNYLAMADSQGGLWLSDKLSGIKRLDPSSSCVNVTPPGAKRTFPFILNIVAGNDGTVWYRTMSAIAGWNPDSSTSASLGRGGYGGFVLIDSEGDLWTISESKKVSRYSVDGNKASLVWSNEFQTNCFSLTEDKEGSIWVSLYSRIAIIDRNGEISYINGPDGVCNSMVLASGGRIFLYATDGDIYEYGKDRLFSRLSLDGIHNPSCLFVAGNGSLWVGTYNDGIWELGPDFKSKAHYTAKNGLAENGISAIEQDKQGNIWFSTITHIYRINAATGNLSLVQDPYFGDGGIYISKCSAKGQDGNIYFGGSGGVSKIYPDRFEESDKEVPICLDVMVVNGEVISEASLRDMPVFNHRQSNFSFWYSGLDFSGGSARNYSCMLEGLDKDWIDVGSLERAAYSNLRPGKYVFKARVRKQNGEWSENILEVPFTIRYPFFWSPLTWLIYSLIFLVCCLLGVREIIRRQVRKKEASLNKLEDELDKSQSTFVNNISKDFKDSLSLISLPLRELSENKGLDAKSRRLIETMKKYTSRLESVTDRLLGVSPDEDDQQKKQELILSLTSSKMKELNISGLIGEGDAAYMGRLASTIDKNLDNADYSVENLVKDMHTSYSSLYLKIKSLTGKSPQSYITTYRMNVAMELLKSGKYTVSEVCYMVAGSSPSNFSRTFKKQFGLSPSEI